MKPLYLCPLLLGVCVAVSMNKFPAKHAQEIEKPHLQSLSSMAKQNDSCPPEFDRLELLPDNCYLVVEEGYTWWEAHAHCNMFGAELLYIESAEEQSVLEAYIKSKEIDWDGDDLAQMWIGLYKRGRGDWRWSKAGQTVEYTNWGLGANPNFLKTSCCAMNPDTFTWDNEFCNSWRSQPGRNGPDDSTWLYASVCKIPVS